MNPCCRIDHKNIDFLATGSKYGLNVCCFTSFSVNFHSHSKVSMYKRKGLQLG